MDTAMLIEVKLLQSEKSVWINPMSIATVEPDPKDRFVTVIMNRYAMEYKTTWESGQALIEALKKA